MKAVPLPAVLALSLLLAAPPRPVPADVSDGRAEGAHHPGEAGAGAMRAQHERMRAFAESARALCEALTRSDARGALDGAARLLEALKGHKSDIPHRNRTMIREFHGLFAQLGKRTAGLRKDVERGDLQAAAVSYGRVLSVCVSCHRKFRD